MFLDNLMRDRKPQAAALVFVSKKWIEDMIQVLRWNPYPGIADLNLDELACVSRLVSGNESCGYDERPTLSHCLDGIEYEVHKYLFHLFSVNPNLRQVKAKIPSNLNTFFLRFGLQYACNPVYNVIHIFFRHIGARWSRKTQKVVDQSADAVNLLMVNSNSCTATFTQKAGLAALQGPQDAVTTMVAEFRKRRDVIVKRLNEIPGFRCTTPAGAFYAFPNVTGTGISSKELADLLLYEAGVACLNGTAFGKHGDGYLRFSYANSLSNIEEAVRRIKETAGRWAKS